MFDLAQYIREHIEFSKETFGPGARTQGVIDHIRKELIEVEKAPGDVMEWADVIILALDGAWRAGHDPEHICAALELKLAKNKGRKWPDWRTIGEGRAIEHIREEAQDGA